jgi:hypothetical protein
VSECSWLNPWNLMPHASDLELVESRVGAHHDRALPRPAVDGAQSETPSNKRVPGAAGIDFPEH